MLKHSIDRELSAEIAKGTISSLLKIFLVLSWKICIILGIFNFDTNLREKNTSRAQLIQKIQIVTKDKTTSIYTSIHIQKYAWMLHSIHQVIISWKKNTMKHKSYIANNVFWILKTHLCNN